MILITRPVSQTKNLELLLNNRNIDYALFPAFEIIKIQTAAPVEKYDIIIFISGDMFVAIPIVMFLMGLTWGQKKVWVSLTNAIVTPLSIFLLFDYVLQVRFPRGWLTNIYYG